MDQDKNARPIEDYMVGVQESNRGMLFGGGVVLGAVLLALAWLAVSLTRDDPDPGSRSTPAQVGSPSAAPTVTAQATRRNGCAEASQTLSGPLGAAPPAMDQWAVHIGAMNKLVTGAITLRQATAFWDQTRIGAEQRIAEFRRSMRAMRRAGVDCPSPGLLPRSAPPALRACAGRVNADLRTVRAAKTAVDTWDRHVGDMERLRTGKLSAAAAGRMWVAMWQRGQQELTTYRTAARAGRKAGSCDGAPAGEAAPAASPSAAASPSMDMPGMTD